MKRRGRIRQNVASDDPPQEPMDVDAGNRPLADRLEALLDNDKAADVVFVVGDPQKTTPVRIPAVSGLLVAASDAFKAMFIGEFQRPSEVPVPDGDPDAFHIMLRYVYTDKLNLELECALPLLYLAKKCWRIVDKQTPVVLKSPSFLVCDSKTVAEILPRDTLHAVEVDIFQALVDWACDGLKRQSKVPTAESIRETMGELLFLIRFPLMTAQEFTAAHEQCAVLTNEEALSVYKYFATCVQPDLFSCASRAKKRSHFSINFSLTGFRAFVDGSDEPSRTSHQVGYNDLKWSILAKIETNDIGTKSLGFYIEYEGPDGAWSSSVETTMRILSYSAQTRDIIRRTALHAFTDDESDWGYKTFADIQDLLNPSKGFLHDDTILMSIDVFPQSG